MPATPWTWNASRESLGANRVRTRIHGKWINFHTGLRWQAIDLAPQSRGGILRMAAAPYLVELPPLANGEFRFESTNKYDLWSKALRVDQPKGATKRFPTAAAVPGKVTARGVLYSGAFPDLNADLLVQLHEQECRYLVVFRSEPPGDGPVLVPFIQEFDGGEQPRRSIGTGKEPREIERGKQYRFAGISVSTGRFRGVKIKPARVWDSRGKSLRVPIVGAFDGVALTAAKEIQRAFFRGATYPVYTDTTSTFYPDPDTETTSCDGFTLRVGVLEDWATIISGIGTGHDDTITVGTVIAVASVAAGLYYHCHRGWFGFDTSAIPDTDTITSGTMSIYGDSVNHMEPTPAEEVLLATGDTPASDTGLADADYDAGLNCIDEASDRILASAWNQAGYNDFSLTSAGLAAVSKTGVSWFCLRTGSDYDAIDAGYGNSETLNLNGYHADNTGTTEDPVLEIIHDALDKTASGGATLGGSATESATYNETGTGTATCGGAATVEKVLTDTASGGATLGGSATVEKVLTDTASGGVTLGGSATESCEYVVAASGTATLGGTVTAGLLFEETAAGGVVLGGSVTPDLVIDITPAGGVVLGGSATETADYVVAASGAATCGGSATESCEYVVAASGTATLGGTVTAGLLFEETAAGGVVLGGSATVITGTPIWLLVQVNTLLG